MVLGIVVVLGIKRVSLLSPASPRGGLVLTGERLSLGSLGSTGLVDAIGASTFPLIVSTRFGVGFGRYR